MNKLTTLGIILLLTTITGALATDNTWYGAGDTTGNTGTQTSGSFDDAQTSYQTPTSGTNGNDYQVQIADFDGDGESEFMFQSGGLVYYYETDWTLSDTHAHPHSGWLAIANNGECGSGKPGTIGWTTNQWRLYCINSGLITVTDTEPTSGFTVPDGQGPSCGYDTQTRCVIPTNLGYDRLYTIGATLATDLHNTVGSPLSNYSGLNYVQQVPVAKIDGDNVLDYVFYCEPTGDDGLGITIYDDHDTLKMACQNLTINTPLTDQRNNPIRVMSNNWLLTQFGNNHIGFDILGILRFQKPFGTTTYARAGYATGDLDGDGNPDEWARGGNYTNGTTHHSVLQCYTNTGTSLGACGFDYNHGSGGAWNAEGMSTADVNGDDEDELIIASGIYDNDDGSTLLTITGLTGWDTTGAGTHHIADVNNDTYLDILNSRSGYSRLYESTGTHTPTCGDGIIDSGEQCDDGNTNNGDGCSSICQIEYDTPDVTDQQINPDRNQTDGNTMYVDIAYAVTDTTNDKVNCTTFLDWNDTIDNTGSLHDLSHVTSPYNVQTGISTPKSIPGGFPTVSDLQGAYTTGMTAYRIRTYCNDNTTADWTNNDHEEDWFIAFNSTVPLASMQVIVRDADTNWLIDNAYVYLPDFTRNNDNKVYVYTDGSGQVTFTYMPGPLIIYDISVTKTGYDPGTGICTTGTSPCTIYLNSSGVIDSIAFSTRDSQTLSLIPNVNVTIIHTTKGDKYSQLTNVNGLANFTQVTQGNYYTTLTKNNYDQKVAYYTTGTGVNQVYLEPYINGSTTLTLKIQDTNTKIGIPEFYLIINDVYSNTVYSDYTDSNGEAQFVNINGNTQYDITGVYGTQTQYWSVFATAGQANRFELDFGEPTQYHNTGLNGSQDIIQGVWLSGVKNMQCTNDIDCPSDFCTANGHCSSFNYSVCDANGRPRNQRCIFWATFNGAASGTTDWMLTNFLWLLVILVILVGLGFLVYMFRHKRPLSK